MKTCYTCSSTAFDDMPICFGCLQPFEGTEPVFSSALVPERDFDDDLELEEPFERPAPGSEVSSEVTEVPNEMTEARFHVAVSELFGYDIYLRKEEGAELTIGCARDNNIVLPHTESRRHLLRLYFSEGEIWAQDRGSQQKALIGDTPLTGTRCLRQGAVLHIGEARIEFLAQ